jgi:hypothetical protein
MSGSQHGLHAVGDVVLARPEALADHRRLTAARYVVAQVHDYREDPNPALYLTLVEESVYRYYMDREGGVVADWSPWHAVVDPTEVTRVGSVEPYGQHALFNLAA